MTAASGSAPGRLGPRDGHGQPNTPALPPGSCFPPPDHWAPGRTPQRTPAAPLPAAGLRSVLDRPAVRHTHGSHRGYRRRQSRTPTANDRSQPLDGASPLQGRPGLSAVAYTPCATARTTPAAEAVAAFLPVRPPAIAAG